MPLSKKDKLQLLTILLESRHAEPFGPATQAICGDLLHHRAPAGIELGVGHGVRIGRRKRGCKQ